MALYKALAVAEYVDKYVDNADKDDYLHHGGGGGGGGGGGSTKTVVTTTNNNNNNKQTIIVDKPNIPAFKDSNVGDIIIDNAQIVITDNDKVNEKVVNELEKIIKDENPNIVINKKDVENIVKETSNTVLESIITNNKNNKTDKTEDTTKYENVSQVNNDEIKNKTVNDFISKDIYQNVIIAINMVTNLCNKSTCYLKFDFYINNYNVIYKTLYVKYFNSTGLISKQLYKFSMQNVTEKTLLQNGYLQITAYQLLDCSDLNPIVIGKFKLSNMTNKNKNLTLYKILNIDKIFNFSFDKEKIYPTSITGTVWKQTTSNNLTFNTTGNIVNNTNKTLLDTYNYKLDYAYIKDNQLLPKAIVVNIDNKNVWYNNNNFYCNITFYLKNGNNFIFPSVLFSKLNGKLVLNETIQIDKNKFNLNNVVKFSITYVGNIINNVSTKLSKVILSKQGNIINKY